MDGFTPCLWWLVSRRPQHPDCETCRRSPGGPDHASGDSRDSRDSRDRRSLDRQQHPSWRAAAIQPALASGLDDPLRRLIVEVDDTAKELIGDQVEAWLAGVVDARA